MQCPYYGGSTSQNTKAEIKCGRHTFCFSLPEGKADYIAQAARCLNNTPDRAYSESCCRPFLFRELQRMGAEPQSDHDNKQLQEMYIKLVPQEARPEPHNIKEDNKHMSNLSIVTDSPVSENFEKANRLHREIMANGELAASALVEFCKGLKRMRDEKLYLELGYISFDQYAEEAVGIKQRQAYTYISAFEKLGSTVLQSTAKLGISKIELIASVPALDREDFLAENDLEDLTVKQLKELTDKYNQTCEQLSLLQQEHDDTAESAAEAEKNQEILREEINKLRQQHREETAQLQEKLTKQEEAAKKLKDKNTALKDELKAVKPEDIEQVKATAADDARQKAKAEYEAKLAEEREQAKAEAEQEVQEKLSTLEGETRAAAERAQELEKKLQLAGNNNIIKTSLLFETLQQTFNDLLGSIDAIDDEATAQKLRAAVHSRLLEMAGSLVAGT